MLIRLLVRNLLLIDVLLMIGATRADKVMNLFNKSRPQGSKMFFAIAAPASDQTYSRAFNKTLLNITQSILTMNTNRSHYNITLDTIVIELPDNGSFSAILLETLCQKFEGKHVVAILIIGDSTAAFTVSLAATYSGIPVLWAKGQGGYFSGFRSMESHSLEVHLAPTGREVVQALRGILLQAHWHTFTLLADRTSVSALQRSELWAPLVAGPLHPTLVPLPNPLRAQQIFRTLGDISRSTRGVVVLLCNRDTASKILNDAKRLNMLDGHFVWMWIDTRSTSYYTPSTEDLIFLNDNPADLSAKEQSEKARFRRSPSKSPQGELSDMSVHYLLKNDQFLLFDHRAETESSSFKARRLLRVHAKRDKADKLGELPLGLLSLRPLPIKVDRHLVKGAVRLLISALKVVISRGPDWLLENIALERFTTSCWKPKAVKELNFSTAFASELRAACTDALAGKKNSQEIGVDKVDKSLVANFEILNLVPDNTSKDLELNNTGSNQNRNYSESGGLRWKKVGMISGRSVRLDAIVWPGGDLSVASISTRARTVFRIVTALAPPFVMETELDEDGQCLRGLPCHRVLTSDKDNITLVFNEMDYKTRMEEDNTESNTDTRHSSPDYSEEEGRFNPFHKFKYRTRCCFGLSMDLLENVAQELEFEFRLYIVADGFFGSKTVIKNTKKHKRDVGKKFLSYRFSKDDVSQINANTVDKDYEVDMIWNGIVGDLVSGTAHMSFAPLSVSSARSEVIDYSVPYFFSGVSFLAAPQQKSEIPLMAFLLPFSPELWIAIFTSLNITAVAVAIYEWLSPFGLNPWGRQRSKNFSMSSALWVMWGLLCGHLVAFKAPKSWPNKFLINVWGGFSVIFVASYTANIAALIAGLFFQNTVSNYHDRSLLSQKVGAPRSSASEFYVQKANRLLWEHMRKYSLANLEIGIESLRNGTLDILIADTPILDYYRATDHGCKLQKIGDTINEDTYAIGMSKGFPLKDSISAIIAKYSNNGYMDILQEKWYGGLPCFTVATEIAQPRPLGVAAVTGVFILLGVGMIMGLLILLVEHLFFRYTLPILREKPKGSIWRSRNIMFFSQKLYRFINCVELVSPHHAARELVHTIRQGQITSLFQKSIKRKEHEQRRRRKSKAQFFEMIQEIRRQQQEERDQPLESVTEVDGEHQLSPDDKKIKHSPSIIRRTFMRTSPKMENTAKPGKSPTYFKPLFSPRSKDQARSSTNLNVRRFSTDSVFNSQTLKFDRNAVGRRLSKDASKFLTSSPPDLNSRRSSNLDIITTGNKLSGKSPVLSIENVAVASAHERKLSDSESIGKKLATLPRYEGYDKNKLQPQYSLNIGKSVEVLNKVENQEEAVPTARSYQNILEGDSDPKSNLSDDEIAKRNRLTMEQLHKEIKFKGNKPPVPPKKEGLLTKNNPHIRIQIEDTSSDTSSKPVVNNPLGSTMSKTNTSNTLGNTLGNTSGNTSGNSSGNSCSNTPSISVNTKVIRKNKRHQSLGDTSKFPDSSRKSKLSEQSKSLDSNTSQSRQRSPRCKEHHLPPAPPPPNCSPRNSNGKSPLERLSKDELVLLWRSSESELRSHLLKAIRDKEVTDPP